MVEKLSYLLTEFLPGKMVRMGSQQRLTDTKQTQVMITMIFFFKSLPEILNSKTFRKNVWWRGQPQQTEK